MPFYCPMCSRYLGESYMPNCTGCGFDQPPPQAAVPGSIPASRPAPETVVELKEPDFQEPTGPPCPKCGELTYWEEDILSFKLMGHEITVKSRGLGGSLVNNRATALNAVSLKGWSCSNDHKFFIEYSEEIREICPLCRKPLLRWGNTIRNCKKCHITVPANKFLYMHARELLEEEGWEYNPDMR